MPEDRVILSRVDESTQDSVNMGAVCPSVNDNWRPIGSLAQDIVAQALRAINEREAGDA